MYALTGVGRVDTSASLSGLMSLLSFVRIFPMARLM